MTGSGPGPGQVAVTPNGVLIRPGTGGSPYYRLDYRLEGVRHQPTVGRTWDGAWARAMEADALVAAGCGERPLQPVSVLLGAWVAAHTGTKALRPWSLAYQQIVGTVSQRSITPHLGGLLCGQLRNDDVLAAVAAAPTGPTRAQALTVISAMLHWGYRGEWVVKDPRVLLPKRAQAGVRPIEAAEYPDRAAAAALVSGAGDDLRLSLLLGAGCGLRQGEQFAATGASVRARGSRLLVSHQVVESKGGQHLTAPKYGRTRTVVVPEVVLGYRLRDLLTARAREVGRGGLLCPADRGGWWWKGTYNDRLAVLGGWGSHSLRHFYCRALLDAGVSPADVAVMAGHRSVRTTLDLYVGRSVGAEARVDGVNL